MTKGNKIPTKIITTKHSLLFILPHRITVKFNVINVNRQTTVNAINKKIKKYAIGRACSTND
jgi:hypothetical protein